MPLCRADHIFNIGVGPLLKSFNRLRVEDAAPAKKLRDVAMEKMRDKNWVEAAQLLRQALVADNDPHLEMQLGHALKEAGYHQEAKLAYLRAHEGLRDDEDMLIQLGHFCKVDGHFEEAANYYAKALSLPTIATASKDQLKRWRNSLLDIIDDRNERDDVSLFFSCASTLTGIKEKAIPSGELGRANYSYSFAMRGFQRAAECTGIRWQFLPAPHYVANAQALSRNSRPVHLGFYPPRSSRLLKGAYNILLFAWEFPTFEFEREWPHAFCRPEDMLNIWDEIWVPSKYAQTVAQRYTKRAVRLVPSPISCGAQQDQRFSFSGSRTAKVRQLQRLRWVPLSIFPRMQENFDNHSIDRQTRLVDLISHETKNIFLSIFNPHDQRKQIRPLIEAFIDFSRSHEDAILLLKTVSPDDSNRTINRRILTHQLLQPDELLRPFVSEKVWITNDKLTENEMSILYQISDFYICTSYAEGQNLPLLEAMSQGVIPISVCHTAMADYLTPENAVIIPHATQSAPISLQRTYNLWEMNTQVVASADVSICLERAHQLTPTARDEMANNGAKVISSQFGSKVFSDALANLGSFDRH